MTEPRRWLVYACRTDYTADVVEIIRRRGDQVAALVDNLPGSESDRPDGVVSFTDLDPRSLAQPVVIPLITPGHRYVVQDEARARGIVDFPPLLDPTAVIAASATIGEGAVVNAAAVLAGEVVVGRFVHVNRSASIGHHSELDDFSTLGPGCVLAGRVHLERGAFIGAGAVCAPKVRIGANALVGAGAVVVDDVPAGAVVVGNPARTLRRGESGYGGVSVPP